MHLVADHEPERRCSKQPLRFNIPPNATKQCVSRGGERCKVRRCRTGDKPASAFHGQMKKILEPAQRDGLERGVGGRGDEKPGVLVPRGCKPVCRHRDWKRPANHESEKSSAGRRHGSRRTDFIQFGEYRLSGRCMFGENLFEFGECGNRLLGRCDRASIERFEITARPPRRSVQEVSHCDVKYKPIVCGVDRPGYPSRTARYAAVVQFSSAAKRAVKKSSAGHCVPSGTTRRSASRSSPLGWTRFQRRPASAQVAAY